MCAYTIYDEFKYLNYSTYLELSYNLIIKDKSLKFYVGGFPYKTDKIDCSLTNVGCSFEYTLKLTDKLSIPYI